jgi:uncharacterized protein (DUF952 family)
MIYKILTREQWLSFESNDIFKGAPVDLADGYIHFSTIETVHETARKHFAGQTGLWLLEVDESIYRDELKWETSRGGLLFPHLYAHLKLTDVIKAKPYKIFAL